MGEAFNAYGRVADVYIPSYIRFNKVRNIIFAFVRFKFEPELRKAIEDGNGRKINRSVHQSSKSSSGELSKFYNISASSEEGSSKGTKATKTNVGAVRDSRSVEVSSVYELRCKGETDGALTSWLSKSVVIITKVEESVEVVSERLNATGHPYSKVRKIGFRSFLVSFWETDQIITLEKCNWEPFLNWSLRCFRWSSKFNFKMTVARVAIKGLPWNAWTWSLLRIS
ncbi:hypothetical protein REPUB_Repub17cG0073700 [Reevesia pubescens]